MPVTMSAGYFWFMVITSFVFGVAVAVVMSGEERRAQRAMIQAAADLLSDVAATLRMTRTPLPIALHRRICDFRARFGA